MMDWHPLSVKPALGLFNEATRQRQNSAAPASPGRSSIKGKFSSQLV